MSTEFINTRVRFPRPFAFVIDDMGWIQGSNLGDKTPRGPYRNGVKRKFDLEDYRHVVAVAKAANVRVQAVFILSELDRNNILAKFPTTTYQRDKWDNSANISDEQTEMINYVVSESAHLEFGFHGIGHEHWPADGVQKRAEWYNLEDDHPWPEDTMRQHLEAARLILDQYHLSRADGHSFPETFVPGAYSFYWNPEGDFSLGRLMREAGVKYANTNFNLIPELNPPSAINGGGFDHGLHVLGRLNYGNLWYELDSLPKVPIDMQPTDMVETHWANWLASDDFLQPEVTHKWINYYKAVGQLPDRYVAKNTAQLHSQWLYKKYTVIREVNEGVISIDNTSMPDDAYENNIAGNLVLKFILEKSERLSSVTLDDADMHVFAQEEGCTYVYLPILQQKKYTLKYEVSAECPSFCVCADRTYNVLEVINNNYKAMVSVKMYGIQDMTIYCDRPSKISSEHNELLLKNICYEESARKLTLTLEATDYQGVQGNIVLEWEGY